MYVDVSIVRTYTVYQFPDNSIKHLCIYDMFMIEKGINQV